MTVALVLVFIVLPVVALLVHGRRTHHQQYRGPIQRHPRPYYMREQER